MTESGYYPPGAEFAPRAPYNQPLEEDYKFAVKCDFYNEDGDFIETDTVYVTLSLCYHPNEYDKSQIRNWLYDEIDSNYKDFEIVDYELS